MLCCASVCRLTSINLPLWSHVTIVHRGAQINTVSFHENGALMHTVFNCPRSPAGRQFRCRQSEDRTICCLRRPVVETTRPVCWRRRCLLQRFCRFARSPLLFFHCLLVRQCNAGALAGVNGHSGDLWRRCGCVCAPWARQLRWRREHMDGRHAARSPPSPTWSAHSTSTFSPWPQLSAPAAELAVVEDTSCLTRRCFAAFQAIFLHL